MCSSDLDMQASFFQETPRSAGAVEFNAASGQSLGEFSKPCFIANAEDGASDRRPLHDKHSIEERCRRTAPPRMPQGVGSGCAISEREAWFTNWGSQRQGAVEGGVPIARWIAFGAK